MNKAPSFKSLRSTNFKCKRTQNKKINRFLEKVAQIQVREKLEECCPWKVRGWYNMLSMKHNLVQLHLVLFHLHPLLPMTSPSSPPSTPVGRKSQVKRASLLLLWMIVKIFFHGHLLPLRLFSHLPVSMSRCSSANSLDSFTLPIDKLLDDDDDINNNNNHYAISDDQFISVDHHPSHDVQTNTIERQVREKSKFFLLFKCPRWWRRAREKDHEDEMEERKPKFNISCTMKRYLRLMNLFIPLTRTHWQRNSKLWRHRRYSFSSNIEEASDEGKSQGHRGEISAPASMRTSRTNSGLLMASEALTISTKSDSTMEELQAAIQAAIAHCKKSIATDDRIACV